MKDCGETDIDCGGTCSGCGVGKACLVNADCQAGSGCDVTKKTCDADLCNDGILDGAETDVDCGGGTCRACLVGKTCQSSADCATGSGCDVTTKQCNSSQCHDGIKNGKETDIDCGGGTCPACAVGKACGSTTDCMTGNGCDITTKTCDADMCKDGAKDGSETDVDCGGGTCLACAVGKACGSTADCMTGNGCDISAKTCDADQCHDGIKNGKETDVDCGGGTCPACAVGKSCGSNADCGTGSGCNATTKTCDANLCGDGIQDGAETDVDCGGGTCPGCVVGKVCVSTADCATGNGCDLTTKLCDSSQCHDGIKDGTETDVDCGGNTCAACALGKKCKATSDCMTGNGCDTTTKACVANLCTDGAKNSAETDVDCGGGTCPACAVGKKCNSNADCLTGDGCNATTKTCDANLCGDGIKDGAETDVDCGGGTCSACAVGKRCGANSDCMTGNGCDVVSKKCDANLCHDGILNGDETDVDCGGGTCPVCTLGKKCVNNADCATGEGCDVTTKTCDADLCHDGLQDDLETDVDCGGGTCPACGVGQLCSTNSDCATGEGCDVGTKRCDANLCHDGIQDGTESDIDCGGTTCSACAVGKACHTNADCLSGDGCNATTKKCDANLCTDGLKDGSESDVDCGGATCSACAVGKKCNNNTDCKTGNGCDVTNKVCDANLCNDGIKDGSETDIDCGGGTCTACGLGANCAVNADCGSNNCHSGVCAPACVNTTFAAIGAIQQVTLPSTGNYTIELAGAQGGADTLGDGGQGGWGALARGTFTLTSGDVLQIVVGTRPLPQFQHEAGSGGGGSFVYLGATAFPLPATPLIVGGGGGGGTGSDAVIAAGSGNGGPGGTGGNGTGAGGAGWLTVGGDGTVSGTPAQGGQHWNGGLGSNSSGIRSSPGGFGGGGSCDTYNTGVGGGGGGFTGGNGGNLSGAPAGGGSSYVLASATATTLTPHYQTGNGYVKVVGPLSTTCP